MKDEYLNIKPYKVLMPFLLVFIFFSVLILVFNSFVIIKSGEVGVKEVFGRFDKNELMPGLHFLVPIRDKVLIVDTKVHAINYKGNREKKERDGVIYKPAITVLDKRGLPIKVELTTTYFLKPKMASEILSTWGLAWEEKLVNPVIREVVRDVIGRYRAEEMPQKRPEIAKKIEEDIKKKISRLSQGGVKVISVQLRNILLPSDVEKKIKEVQIAKQEAEKMKYVEEKAKKEQEIAKIKAETEKIKKITLAKAEAQSQLILANATAKANKIISRSIDEKLIKYEYVKALKEGLKENKNVNLFINAPKNSMYLLH